MNFEELNHLIDDLQNLESYKCTFKSNLFDDEKGQLMGDILIVKNFLEEIKKSLNH